MSVSFHFSNHSYMHYYKRKYQWMNKWMNEYRFIILPGQAEKPVSVLRGWSSSSYYSTKYKLWIDLI